ncbi:MAG TPA: hypothetical protein VLM40_12525, partial [Gemmata sp.]|nr:hypothetical protein [Gemmata sp.]
LASLSDPLAAYRRPANVPTHDAVAAARDLDAGIAAYRDGRYEAAVAALSSSAKADPANPIPWYYLGASRWATGATDAAKGDFEQGATREAASDMTRRTISAAISAIQGAARDALNAARP